MYYFLSDTHLGMDGDIASSQREKMMIRWLEEVSADARAIFLVGDIFDFWFEYRRVVPKGFTRVLGKLAELSERGVKIHFFTGNHDMWTFGYLRDECGLEIHDRPEVFDLYGKRVFIAHGDNMYIKKPPMEKFMHWCFHSKAMRWIFRTLLHPDLVLRFGQWWSGNSRKSHTGHAFRGEQEYLIQYARQYQKALCSMKVDYFIFGHIHCAELYDMGGGQSALFLGEWLSRPVYGALHPDGRLELRDYK